MPSTYYEHLSCDFNEIRPVLIVTSSVYLVNRYAKSVYFILKNNDCFIGSQFRLNIFISTVICGSLKDDQATHPNIPRRGRRFLANVPPAPHPPPMLIQHAKAHGQFVPASFEMANPTSRPPSCSRLRPLHLPPSHPTPVYNVPPQPKMSSHPTRHTRPIAHRSNDPLYRRHGTSISPIRAY
jgi:hypothetical protein